MAGLARGRVGDRRLGPDFLPAVPPVVPPSPERTALVAETIGAEVRADREVSSTDAVLAVRSVTKAFGGNRAVDDCSFTVRRGSITGLIGPNGAGKSTLLNIVAGALRADQGSVLLDGEPISGRRPDELLGRGLARTFQVPRPIPSMTVLENLVLAGQGQVGERLWTSWCRPNRVGLQENAIVDKALGILGYVNLGRLRDAPAGTLSGGQKKLLEFARSLMAEPKLVLLDEPAAGVNRTLMRQLTALIEEQCHERGVTFLVVEHDMDLVARLCDPVIVMSQGRPIFEGTFDEVRRDEEVLSAYLGGQFR
ncbi:MAG: Branched-chain amino acid transport ATP-binding protein LivG [uncultured Thermomicrobiales bacterium]|uniref:Branched-chain amino acid transport ATP-binding protein LivG n=1 Tax=uncultured Thermomicrobiales bacterium TaxID=1645740 RepID=A0A6J4UJT2_9BACT|nr:MAG: Branched-chain amino acid transport ATP-binding protein LivG [uncultured Thermomicrobiales bacterium]